MVSLNKIDALKFFLYTAIFTVLLTGYNRASSPFFETTFNSASIFNQETIVTDESQDMPVEVQQKPTPSKRVNPSRPALSLAFNPDYIHLDDTVLTMLKTNIDSSYFKPKVTPLNLEINGSRKDPRGQVLGNKLILSSAITNDSEMLKVLVHELGHVIDIFYLKKGTFSSDPSFDFYAISWDAYNIKKKGMKLTDFVSGYALSNQYEDFAESFAFYVFHNEDFARLAMKNVSIKQKYDFFASKVFQNNEFVGTSFETAPLKTYNWDTTKIGINLKKYLYYIQ